MADGVKSKLQAGAQAVDEYLAKEAVGIAKNLRKIVESGCREDSSRVAAARVLLEWVRPPKGGALVQINLPAVESKLNLPPAPPPIEAQVVPRPKARELPRIGPERRKLTANFRGNFQADGVVGASGSTMAEVEVLTGRGKDPERPAAPPPASSIKPLPTE